MSTTKFIMCNFDELSMAVKGLQADNVQQSINSASKSVTFWYIYVTLLLIEDVCLLRRDLFRFVQGSNTVDL
jgi:hypothetical protein